MARIVRMTIRLEEFETEGEGLAGPLTGPPAEKVTCLILANDAPPLRESELGFSAARLARDTLRDLEHRRGQ